MSAVTINGWPGQGAREFDTLGAAASALGDHTMTAYATLYQRLSLGYRRFDDLVQVARRSNTPLTARARKTKSTAARAPEGFDYVEWASAIRSELAQASVHNHCVTITAIATSRILVEIAGSLVGPFQHSESFAVDGLQRAVAWVRNALRAREVA